MARPALTRTRIVAAGVAIAHELGLPAVDLRSVARRVNTTATGLRRHIGTTELVAAVVTEIVATMPAVPTRGDHLRRLRSWTSATRDWLSTYPGLAAYLMVNRWDVPQVLDRLEGVARLLVDAGMGDDAVPAAISMFWFVLSGADLHTSPRIIGWADESPDLDQSGDAVRWPLLDGTVGDYSPSATATQFDFGVELLIEAITARAGVGAVVKSQSREVRRRSPTTGAKAG